MKCENCKKELENTVTEIEKFRFDFIYKSYEDGVKNNAIIDTKTQVFLAYLGVTLVPLNDYYKAHSSSFDSFFSFFGMTLLLFIIALIIFFQVLREPFDKFDYLGKEANYSYFFPKKYEDDKTIENLLQIYKSTFENAQYETLLDNMILERLKFQHVYYLKIALFRKGIYITTIYTTGLLILLFS